MKKLLTLSSMLLITGSMLHAQNLATSAIITSNYNYNLPYSNVVDNNLNTVWVSSPNVSIAATHNLNFHLNSTLNAANITIKKIAKPFDILVSSDGINYTKVRSSTTGAIVANFYNVNNVYNNFSYIRISVSLPAYASFSVAEVEIYNSPSIISNVTVNNAMQAAPGYGLNNMFDGNPSTFFMARCDQGVCIQPDISINLTKTIYAAKIAISATDKGIIVKNCNNTGLYNSTIQNTDELYIVDPAGFTCLNFSNIKTLSPVFELNIIEISLNSVAMNFTYDAIGNMSYRTIVFGSNKSGEAPYDEYLEPYYEIDSYKAIGISAEKFTDRELFIYPNPTKGLLNLTLSQVQPDDIVLIEIFTLEGIKTREVQMTSQSSIIDIGDEPPGVYLLRMTINSQTHNWKIIKQ
jgi:hypothetical protein